MFLLVSFCPYVCVRLQTRWSVVFPNDSAILLSKVNKSQLSYSDVENLEITIFAEQEPKLKVN